MGMKNSAKGEQGMISEKLSSTKDPISQKKFDSDKNLKKEEKVKGTFLLEPELCLSLQKVLIAGDSLPMSTPTLNLSSLSPSKC